MTEIYDPFLERVVKHHTLEKNPQLSMFHLSNGGVSDHYIDLRSAWLCHDCDYTMVSWHEIELARYVRDTDKPWWPALIATGVYGAVAVSYLSSKFEWSCKEKAIWNPKGHGVLWSGSIPVSGSDVVILDDVVSTGTTLENLRTACEREGWNVLGEIVPVRRTT